MISPMSRSSRDSSAVLDDWTQTELGELVAPFGVGARSPIEYETQVCWEANLVSEGEGEFHF